MSYLDSTSKALGEVKLQSPEAIDVEAFKIPGDEVNETPAEPPTVSRVDSGIFTNEIVKDEELKGIAAKHGVKLQQLRDMADLYGATREVGLDEAQGKEALKNPNFYKSMGLEAAGILDDLGMNVPSWVYKKMQSEEGEKAFDAVRKLVDERRSMAGTAMRVALPGAGAKMAQAAKGIKAAVGVGAGLGAVSGLTSSKSGEELESAAEGAAMSGALAGALSPEAISKMQGIPIFKKIVGKFSRPETVVKQQGEATTEMIESTARRWKSKGAIEDLGEARGEAYVSSKFQAGTAIPVPKGNPDLMARGPLEAAHEFMHGQFMSISNKAGIAYAELISHANSIIDKDVVDLIKARLKKSGADYPEARLDEEVIPWMISAVNDKASRNDLSLSTGEMKSIKKELRKFQSWAEDIDEQRLSAQIAKGEGARDIAAIRKAPMQKPTKAELEKLPLEGDFINIPGFKIVDNGFSYDVFIDGRKVGSDASYEFAKTRAQDWKRKNPDKLEKLVEKPEPRGTYIPPED